MTYNDKYKAVIRPRPELVGSEILWGWDVNLTDRSDDKVYPFSGGAVHPDVDVALQEGAVSMIKWMQALDVVSAKAAKPDINLDAELPVPAPEETPAEAETEAAASEEEKLEEAVDEAPAAPETKENNG